MAAVAATMTTPASDFLLYGRVARILDSANVTIDDTVLIMTAATGVIVSVTGWA